MTGYYRPDMLPKVRSEILMDAIGGEKIHGETRQPFMCSLRISSFIAGHRCADRQTVVGAHLGRLGKGRGTKVSDLNVAAACMNCHALVDMVDNRWFWLMEHHGVDVMLRILAGLAETQAKLTELGIIKVSGAKLI